MTDKQVLRYLYLVDQRLQLFMLGTAFTDEDALELQVVDEELKQLRAFVDEEHARRAAGAVQ